MEKQQLEKIEKWFDEYVGGFYGDDDVINANIELKDKHSRLVCNESMYIANELELNDQQKMLAELIGLLHDIGRFKQFMEYQTYNDPRSINHSELGVEILREHKVLAELDADAVKLIQDAIMFHNLKKLPDGIDGELLLQSQIIRDADKIDIYRVVTEYYEQYRNDPESFKLEIELPDETWYSDEVLQKVINGERIDYRALKTWNDCKLVQLSWVYDMNFVPTFKRVKERKFLEKIIDFLPQNDDIKRVEKIVLGFVNSKINQG